MLANDAPVFARLHTVPIALRNPKFPLREFHFTHITSPLTFLALLFSTRPCIKTNLPRERRAQASVPLFPLLQLAAARHAGLAVLCVGS